MEIYSFGLGMDGLPSDMMSAEVLGGKGAGLVWMDSIGVNVPPGFILPCFLMAEYQKKPKTFMKDVAKEIKPWLKKMEKHFGYMPLVSVRSGARQSMPGMMDTILNVGIDHKSWALWQEKLGSDCLINSHHRLVEMYGNVVKGLDKKHFKRVSDHAELEDKYHGLADEMFPMAEGQLLGAIEAVFKSWNNQRAKDYRKIYNIPDDWGTAVVVQAMVFGNLNSNSGTGVLFTRNPDTGEDKLVGEFAVNAQGEDVVDGSTTPMPLPELEIWNPVVAKELAAVAEKLETAKKDVQDVEFTIQDGKLYILQTRNAKRTPTAALRMAVEMYEQGMIGANVLYHRLTIEQFDKAQQVVVDPTFEGAAFANGTAACSGVVTGKIVTSAQAAIDCAEPCILVTQETNPNDIEGMYKSVGIVTMTGGSTCHAAVVARGMNKPCIVGVGRQLKEFPAGTTISIDGANGCIWMGTVPVIDGTNNEYAWRYLKILRNTLGYIPIVSNADAGGAKAVMYHPSGSPANLTTDIENVKLLLKQVDQLYVDCRYTRLDDAETKFYSLFHVNKVQGYSELYTAMNGLLTSEKQKITVIGQPVVAKPMAKITEVQTLEDLIEFEGMAIMGGLSLESAAVKKVLGWRKGDPDFEFIAYGGIVEGTKSFASDVLALQSKDSC